MPRAAYRPQLARLVKDPPEGDDWLHEMKYDGYRIGCIVTGTSVSLISRNGKDWTAAFPEVVAAVRLLGIRDSVLDGELVIVLPGGRTSFQALQNAFGERSRRGLAYYVFDVMRLRGESVERQPLERRKQLLASVIGKSGARAVVRYSEHVIGRGRAVFEDACRLQLEGIISKRRDAPYKAGRGDTWLKTKCVRRQEFVIGGFTDPEGSREGIGALLIGYYDAGGALVFAGKVGTGFSVATARDLRKRLGAISRERSPFTPAPTGALAKRAHWVAPRLVGEVVFTEWTSDGKIRHPSFQGLRRDKPARAVTREIAAAPPGKVPKQLGRKPAPRRTRAPATRESKNN